MSRTVAEFFTRYDLLITPSSASTARKIGEFQCDRDTVDLQAWNHDIYRYDGYYPLYNATGNPAISLPLFQNQQNLPIGVQFAVALGNDALHIRAASFFEQALPWSMRVLPVHMSNI